MIAEPLMQPAVADQLQRLAKQPPHGLLLTGQPGSGKTTIAHWLIGQILGIAPSAVASQPYVSIIEPTNRSIGIDAVRSLEHTMSLKSLGKPGQIARVVIIQDAHLLTGEAQNALLKMLEEPPKGTMLILTASQAEALLPTVRSRLQTVDIGQPPAETVRSLLAEQGRPAAEIAKIMALSGGLPGVALAMAQGDESHPLVVAAHEARQLLQKTSFERLAMVDKLSKDRELCANVMYILMQMSHAALLSGRGAERWQKVLQASYDTQTALNNGAQPKLALTNLMLTL